MQNDTRDKVVREALGVQKYPEPFDKGIARFMDGYMVCAKNRNLLMHSHHGGIFHNSQTQEHGLVLSRNTRGGGQLSFLATKTKLRTVADDMNRFSEYGIELYLKLQTLGICRRKSVDFDYDRNIAVRKRR